MSLPEEKINMSLDELIQAKRKANQRQKKGNRQPVISIVCMQDE
jgi:hypothetical protein